MIVLDSRCKYAYGLSNNLKYTRLPTTFEDISRHGNQTSGMIDTHHFDHVPHVFRLGAARSLSGLEARIIKLLTVAPLSIFISIAIDKQHIQSPQLLHCMSRPLVRALCRSGGAFGAPLTSSNGGGLRGGAVSIRKVPLVGLIAAAAPRCSISCSSGGTPFPVPAVSRLRNKNTTTARFSLTNPWDTTTRHCSSHASSSLVKMATDRDILSDEYVSLPAFIPLSILSLEIADNFFSTVSSRPTTTSLCSIFSLMHPGHTKVALLLILR